MSKAEDLFIKISSLRTWVASNHEQYGAAMENRSAKVKQKGFWKGNLGATGDQYNAPHPFLPITTKTKDRNTKYLKEHAEKVRKETKKEAAVRDWVSAGQGIIGAHEDNKGANIRAKGIIVGSFKNIADQAKSPHPIAAITTKRREEQAKYYADKANATRKELAKKKED